MLWVSLGDAYSIGHIVVICIVHPLSFLHSYQYFPNSHFILYLHHDLPSELIIISIYNTYFYRATDMTHITLELHCLPDIDHASVVRTRVHYLFTGIRDRC